MRAGRRAVVSGLGSGTPAVQRTPGLLSPGELATVTVSWRKGLCCHGVTYHGESALGNTVLPAQPWLPELLVDALLLCWAALHCGIVTTGTMPWGSGALLEKNTKEHLCNIHRF